MRSGHYYIVTRSLYSRVSTHTILPYPSLLLYPLSGASRTTHMLQFNEIENMTLGWAVPIGYIIIRATAMAFQHSERHTGLGFVFPLWGFCLQVGLWLGRVSAFSSK